MARVLVTRPQPGADTTAERLSALGHDVRTAPLFTVHSLQWSPPGEVIDALMVTSANAMRLSGPLLEAWRALPCYAVGEATAKAAAERGFTRIIVGDGDASALAAQMAADGVGVALHLAGREHRAVAGGALRIVTRTVYAADPVGRLGADVESALSAGTVDRVLLYSARAAGAFAALMDGAGIDRGGVALGAMSDRVADAAGEGWRGIAVAPAPVEDQLFAACGLLCDKPQSTVRDR